MKLHRSIDDPGIEQPEDSDVLSALDHALNIPESANEEERIVLLSDGSGLPDAGEPAEQLQLTSNPFGWVVEYTDLRSGTMRRSPRGLPAGHVRELFLRFLQRDDAYREAIRWRDVSHPGRRARRRSAFGVILLIVAFLVGAGAVVLLASLAT